MKSLCLILAAIVTFVSYCSFALHAQDADACTSKTYYHREPKALSSEVISTPFVVRDISGTITYNGGKPLEGAYLEMPTGTTSEVANQSSPRGDFILSSLNVLGPFAWSAEAGPGTYCFRVTKADFHSLFGMIVVHEERRREPSLLSTSNLVTATGTLLRMSNSFRRAV